ncbi:DUF4065 domain-containing protein [Helicobacter muridarum]|uniref:DUF4065 domain-containing protein n=1 Tax=Helicobacter muridarum TaxID=216 RepID=A0A099U1X3_9HELI|nr:Panacea domain-containing protein [Helicobacter muridarum]TLD98109.1 DUF4065 domain-containing protein [Helicobacter muridarum]STQ85758.1 Uncharacterized phage-associated protein [Helicobacter muridarum]
MNKTEAIIAYIVNYFQCNDALNNLGKVKLVKILWFADREFMHKYYKQLTNLEYRKMPQGPMPTNIDKILKNMQEKEIIKSFETSKYGYSQTCFLCLKEPDLDYFSAMEISILDKVIMDLKHKSAKQISNQTHDELWNSIEQGKVMPLESVFLQDIIPATKDDVNG